MKSEKIHTAAIIVGMLLLAAMLQIILFISGAPENEKPTVGILLPLSGNNAKHGNAILDGIREVFDSGDCDINYRVIDTKGNPDTSLEELKRLHSEGCYIVIGPLGSDNIKNTVDFARENGMILLIPYDNTASISSYDNVYRMSSGQAGEAYYIAGIITNLIGTQNYVEILYDTNNSNSAEIAEILKTDTYLNTHFSGYKPEIISTIFSEKETPDLIIWIGAAKEGAELTKDVNKFSKNTKLLMSVSATTDEYIYYAGQSAEKVRGITYPFGPEDDIMYMYYGYDTARILDDIISGGAKSTADISKKLKHNVYEGYTGMKFFRNSNTAPPYYDIKKVEDGIWLTDNKLNREMLQKTIYTHGAPLSVKPLFNNGHNKLPIPHGIYD